MSKYKSHIAQATTAEQFINNVGFQLANIEGYLQMASDDPEDAEGALWMAQLKAQALREAADGLVRCMAERNNPARPATPASEPGGAR
jgi:hypothetical protein